MHKWAKIQDFALDNYGLLTTSKAAALNVSPAELSRWTRIGRLEKRAYGVFRLASRTPTDFDRYAEALAIVGNDSQIFGESVLAIHNLAMVNPAKIEVATQKRIRRNIPQWIRIVSLPSAGEAEMFDGIACQPLEEAIMVCIGRVPGDRLLAAVVEARANGLIGVKQYAMLKKELK